MGLTQHQKKRKRIFEKFNGRCAYTGTLLHGKWEIDHLTPLQRNVKGAERVYKNNLNNLMPTFKFINMFKKNRDLEAWRQYLLTFHKRLVASKINGVDVRVRAKHRGALMKAFGIKKDTPFSGVFYFETLPKTTNEKESELPPYKNISLENIQREIWQPLIMYKNYYSVSSFGRVKCILRTDSKGQTRAEKIKKPQVSTEGYLTTLLSVDKVRLTKRLDFLVAETFIPNPNNFRYVHHRNSDKLDLRVKNLYWSNKKIIKIKPKIYIIDSALKNR